MEKNARNGSTCWPHFPGVIATVEQNVQILDPNNPGPEPRMLDYVATSYEARIYGQIGYFHTYEAAVAWCEQEKRIAAWHEEQLAADARRLVQATRGFFGRYGTIAEELA